MSREEGRGGAGHEITHVANGDMVTLTLIQGVLNTFVFSFLAVVGFIVEQGRVPHRAQASGWVITHGDGVPDRVRDTGLDHRLLVLAPSASSARNAGLGRSSSARPAEVR